MEGIADATDVAQKGVDLAKKGFEIKPHLMEYKIDVLSSRVIGGYWLSRWGSVNESFCDPNR